MISRKMAKYRLSTRADSDIAGIAYHSIKKFGVTQARRYREGLEESFRALAEDARRGRRAEHLASNLRRYNYESHVIFFLPEKKGVLIVRVLHQRMDFQRHPLGDD